MAFHCIFASLVCAQVQQTPVSYVNPFIGTENSGNTFPGPSLPFGMVRLSPDCKTLTGKSPNSNSGYVSKAPVYGFSHTHVSGTGGGAKYGNIQMMPITGVVDLKDHSTAISAEAAGAGYYTAQLDRYHIQVELTTTHSVGLHQYTFPQSAQSNIMIDAASFLIKGSGVQKLVNSSVQVISNTEVEGSGTVSSGWNNGAPYTVYFYARFDTPARLVQTWCNGVLSNASAAPVKQQNDVNSCGAVLSYQTYAGQKIVSRVGISFISTAKARQNLEKEAAHKTFDQVKEEASSVWNNLLQRIQVSGGTVDDKKTFYTALYHLMLMPSDRTGENPLWQSSEPYYDDYYAIWDTFRASNPLITLIDQKREEDIVRSLLNISDHEGYMPDARSGNFSGTTQGGSNCDMLIADAYVKGLKNIDYKKAYAAMIKNAEIEPANPAKEGRLGLNDYKTLGYIPSGASVAGSRTMEFAANDAAIATVAKSLGNMDDYNKYLKRANNWQNIWRQTAADHGETGFVWPKKKDGTWEDDFSVKEKGSFKKGYLYEGDSWTYSFYVPQDVKKLIRFCGGNQAFMNRLDTFFVNKYYDVNNEPGFLTPCLYIWAGRPDKTAQTVNSIRKAHYGISRGGLPGNDDSGAMSGWFAFQAMGIYPNAGQNVYLIGSPLFSNITVKLANQKTFNIKALNLSGQNIYVQSAKLNGLALNKAWFRHSDIANGGTLELTMGSRPANWGISNPPPSLSDQTQ